MKKSKNVRKKERKKERKKTSNDYIAEFLIAYMVHKWLSGFKKSVIANFLFFFFFFFRYIDIVWLNHQT